MLTRHGPSPARACSVGVQRSGSGVCSAPTTRCSLRLRKAAAQPPDPTHHGAADGR